MPSLAFGGYECVGVGQGSISFPVSFPASLFCVGPFHPVSSCPIGFIQVHPVFSQFILFHSVSYRLIRFHSYSFRSILSHSTSISFIPFRSH